jgi:hypothetical protein
VKLTKQEILKLSVAIMYLGLLINLAGGAVFYTLGRIVKRAEIVTPVEAGPLQTLGYALMAVSVMEVAIAVVLKRKWISSKSPQLSPIRKRVAFHRQVKILFAILFVLALSPSLYGFLFYILGGDERLFVLMVVCTLIGYMLIRVRPDSLEKAVGDLELEDVD